MSEALENQTPPEPVEPEPKIETPPWDFGTPDPPEPQYATVDQINELKELILQGRPKAQQEYENPLDQQLAAINELQFTDPVKADRLRLALVGEQIRAATDALSAPLERDKLIGSLTKGLGPEAREYLSDHLAEYSASQLKGIQQDKKTQDILRDAAENACRRKSGPNVPAPKSETTANIPDVRIDAQSEQELDLMYRAFKDAGVPNLPTRDVFMAQMMEAN